MEAVIAFVVIIAILVGAGALLVQRRIRHGGIIATRPSSPGRRKARGAP